MSLRVWLVRHGRTLFNDLNLVQGWCDAPLTTEGISQASALGAQLADVEWAAAYSSPSERAMDTAEIVLNGCEPQIVRERRWKEFNFGVMEGQPTYLTFASHSDPDAVFRGILDGDDIGLARGETGSAFVARIRDAIADLRATHQAGDVLVVTHGWTIVVALSQFIDVPDPVGLEVGNATFSIIEFPTHGAPIVTAVGADSLTQAHSARYQKGSNGNLD